MKTFCFTVDDNIRFLKEITENAYPSLFDHPYPAMYKRLHEEFGLKVQLNLFYRLDGFDLSQMTAAYYDEWQQNADWLRLSFHSEYENVRPYEFAGYDEVYGHCRAVHEQIIRFASPAALAQTTTVHYCRTTDEGLRALADNGVRGLLGLYGDEQCPGTSYGMGEQEASRIRGGEVVYKDGMAFAPIDIVLNGYSQANILRLLDGLIQPEPARRETVWVMIHEQYFYPDYFAYQPDFEEKLRATFAFLTGHGYKSRFFEERLSF